MRHVAVRRLAVLLGAAFLLWAGVFVLIVRREPAAEPPPVSPSPAVVSSAALYDRHCGSCHAAGDLRATQLPAAGGTSRAELEKFLESHGDAPADDDRQILDYLGDLPPQ